VEGRSSTHADSRTDSTLVDSDAFPLAYSTGSFGLGGRGAPKEIDPLTAMIDHRQKWTGLVIIILIFTGCSQAPAPQRATEFLGHHLGETALEWKLIEEPLGPDPVQVCQDIIKSGVNAETDNYKDCATFLVSGQYSITTHDWKTMRERIFRFEGWKLAAIVEKFSGKERDDVGRELNLKFGVPQKSDSASASWQKSDAKIQVFYRDDGGAVLVTSQ
jgi:hypothetical protein